MRTPFWLFALSLVLLLGCTAQSSSQKAQLTPTPALFSLEEGVTLVNQLLYANSPQLPENAYMPEALKQAVIWVYNESTTGTMKLHFIPTYRSERDRVTLMHASYEEGRPAIEIYIPRLLTIVRVQHQVPQGFNEECKNLFAIELAHQVIHLERDLGYFSRKKSSKDTFDEELRTWRKLSVEIIRPLRLTNHPLTKDLLMADTYLLGCTSTAPCQAFEEFVRSKIP